MFGRGKLPEPVAEKTLAGWSYRDVADLAKRFARDRPNISFQITGVSHVTAFDGERFASAVSEATADLELYNKHALAFQNRPTGEDHLSLTENEDELTGYLSPTRARMRCWCKVGEADEIEKGRLGGLSLTAEYPHSLDKDYKPIVEARFYVQSAAQQTAIRQTIQAALSGRGGAFMNFVLFPILDGDDWIRSFEEKGYSPSLKIVGAYLTTTVGQVSAD